MRDTIVDERPAETEPLQEEKKKLPTPLLYIPEGTEQIERYAYYERDDIEVVVFPDSVEEICGNAFMGCVRISEIVLPPRVKTIGWNAFSDCKSLHRVVIPSGVTSIGWGAFKGCTGLGELVIPQNVKTIKECAFEGCMSLALLVLPVVFRGRTDDMGIPPTTTVVFENRPAEDEASKKAPEAATKETASPFGGQGILKKISSFVGTSKTEAEEKPQGESEIKKAIGGAFASVMNTVTAAAGQITDKIGEVAGAALSQEKGKEAPVAEPSALETPVQQMPPQAERSEPEKAAPKAPPIAAWAHKNDPTLTRFEVPEGTRIIGAGAFEGCFALCEVVIPSSVEVIGASAFAGCMSLREIALPVGLKRIESKTFANCKMLEKVYIPEGVEEIGFNAFDGCLRLTDIRIPESVRSIAPTAFAGCISLPFKA
ncbi:MAG: leucine-rich repeat protein [Oscillospiraceae bacterium]|nr:leucine-rich repeat protein [Oscillospiraceae bacterium]